SRFVSALTESSLPIRPAASVARLRITGLGLEKSLRRSSSQRRSSSALVMTRRVEGGIARVCPSAAELKERQIRSAQRNLLGIGHEYTIRPGIGSEPKRSSVG